jgi:hypothetical protein
MLAKKESLATLNHKVDQRQLLIEALFEQYSGALNVSEIQMLKAILVDTNQLIKKMESAKLNKRNRIIEHKNKGKRIHLYTSIAKQK